jgi:hypothetical protein
MATPRDLLIAAFAVSAKNQPDKIATQDTELLRVVNASLKACAAIAARVNPAFPFAKTADVAFSAGGWAVPSDAEAIFYIENADSDEVVVVPFDERRAALGDPAVYLLGKKLLSAGNTLDPTSGTLTLWYSYRPADATIDGTIDANWLTDFNSLPVYDIAAYLAQKDGRIEEAQSLAASRNSWLAAYVAHLEHVIVAEVRRFGNVRYTNPSSLVSLSALLVSGSGGPGSASGAT